ncbi:unnamed protein product [Durusdinium trenchii]|uniref:Uncharacterized protein n=1 Tax=Durusdinium trenchii TaxID=1381693 RepID=A0ABP0R807_9DINO
MQASFLVGIYTEVMVFGLAHGTYRGTMQLVCAASGYIGALLAFMRTDLPNNWTQDLIRSRSSRKGDSASPTRYAFWHSMWHVIFPASSSCVVLISVHVPGQAPLPRRSATVYISFVLCCLAVGLLWAAYNSFISRGRKRV